MTLKAGNGPLCVTVCMDSFKGSVSAYEAGEAVKRGLTNCCPDARVYNLPISDGGEGLLEAIRPALEGQNYLAESVRILGAYGERTTGSFIHDRDTCVIEMAQCCGLDKYPREELRSRDTTTYGLGQITASALGQGISRFRIGLGGSATNDGGAGFAQALGARFIDGDGREIAAPIRSRDLIRIKSIDVSGLNPRLKDCEFIGTCDVDNPMLGLNGATFVFGRQKGADDDDLLELEDGMRQYAKILKLTFGTDYSPVPGTGAAGALGAGLMYFCNARLRSGIETVLDIVNFDEYAQKSDLVIVGEGRMDEQSAHGKAPAGVAARAARFGVPAVALCGSYTPEARVLYKHNIHALFAICPGPVTLEQSIYNARSFIELAAENLMRLYLLARGN